MNLRVAPRLARFDAQAPRYPQTGLYGARGCGTVCQAAQFPNPNRAVHDETCYPSPYMRSGGFPFRSHFFDRSCARRPRRMAHGRPREERVDRWSRAKSSGDHKSCAADSLLLQFFLRPVPCWLAVLPAISSAPASARPRAGLHPPRSAAASPRGPLSAPPAGRCATTSISADHGLGRLAAAGITFTYRPGGRARAVFHVRSHAVRGRASAKKKGQAGCSRNS